MNKDRIEGNWEQFKGKIKETWGKLTDDDVALLNGNRQQFLGKLQEKYGLRQEESEKRLKDLEQSCGCSATKGGA